MDRAEPQTRGAVDRSSREVCSTGPQPQPGDSGRHQSCRGEGETTAGEFLKPIMWPIIRSTPDAGPGQPQTKKRKCGIQSAHQSLFTDVFGSRLLLCTIHQSARTSRRAIVEAGIRALCA
jgi:hypothetical protein